MATSAPVETVPLVASVPDQPPLAVHEVALVAVQVSVELLPLAIVAGLGVSVIVGRGAILTVVESLADPPGPVQVSL